MSQRYGIDLGTTNSSVTLFDGHELLAFRGSDSSEILPSCVELSADGSSCVRVGAGAYASAAVPGRLIAEKFKRLMGTNYRFPDQSRVEYEKWRGRSWRAEDLSAEVLKELDQWVRLRNPEGIKAAVITVPAAFNTQQREATFLAARSAGFADVQLVQEPVAAGLSLACKRPNFNGSWVIFDWGGGTLDVSLTRVQAGRVEFVAAVGDNHNGGADWDQTIVEGLLLPYLRQQAGDDLADCAAGKKYFKILQHCAEKIKIGLTNRAKVVEELPVAAIPSLSHLASSGLSIAVDRSSVDRLVKPLVLKAAAFVEQLLAEQRMSAQEIDAIVLVGGPTRYPLVRSALTERLGIRLESDIDPMLAVSQGAAIYAFSLGPVLSIRSERSSAISQIKFGCPLMTSERFCPVPGSVVGGAVPKHIRFKSASFDTGWLQIDPSGQFDCEVELQEKILNEFTIQAVDSNGAPIQVEPTVLRIKHGLSIDSPPLPHSIGVATDALDPTAEKEMAFILQRGTPLPATNTYEFITTKELLPERGQDSIMLELREGESSRAELNDLLDTVSIKASDLPRGLPKGQDVEVTLEYDVSGTLKVSVFVPYLNVFVEEVREHNREELRAESQMGYLKEIDSANQSLARLAASSDEQVAFEAKTILEENELEALRVLSEAAVRGDADAIHKVNRQLRSIRARIVYLESLQQVQDLQETYWALIRDLEDSDLESTHEDRLAGIRSRGDEAVKGARWEQLKQANEALIRLKIEASRNDPAFWAAILSRIEDSPPDNFTNPVEARAAIRAAQLAIQSGDTDELRTNVIRLFRLRLGDSDLGTGVLLGIRKRS